MSVSHVSHSLQSLVSPNQSVQEYLPADYYRIWTLFITRTAILLRTIILTLDIIMPVQLWVTGEKAQPLSGQMRGKRPYPSEVMEICVIVLKVVACLACWCRGKTCLHQLCYVGRHWWHSRSQISHELSDILLTCTWVCMGLDGSTCSESLPVRTCRFEPPVHVPRTSARAQTCAVMFRRAPCVPRSEEHKARPADGRAKMPKCQKNTFTHRNAGFLLGMCFTWNPGGDARSKGTRR